MLKFLVRITSLGIAIFLTVLAGIYISISEEAFPHGSEFTASLDFSQIQIPKDEAITSLEALTDSSGLHLAKIVADPDDFFNSRSLYVFGKEAPDEPRELEWFKAGMHGELRSAESLGAASLSGTYVYSGPPAATIQLTQWLDSHGVKRLVSAKDGAAVLQQAVVTTGAWLTFLTCFVLLITLVISWYVLRARARSLKVLCGAPAGKVILEDLISLLRAVSIPAAIGLGASLIVVAMQGKTSYLFQLALTSAGFIGCALAVAVICALLVSTMTWPSVKGIASRQPPERHFQRISEALKAATLVLVTITLPVVGASIADATNLSNQNAQWEVLKDNVSVRIATRSPEEFEKRQTEMHTLAEAAEKSDKLTFSYALEPANLIRQDETASVDLGGYDGVVLANPAYLEVISPLIGTNPSSAAPLGINGERLTESRLPVTLRDYLDRQFPIWNRAGMNLNGLESLQFYNYSGRNEFPALTPVAGKMAHFRNPLIIVVDDPPGTFNDGTTAAFLSSGNLTFSDAGWTRSYLSDAPLGNVVLSVDRISDAALFNSQLQNQSAGMKSLSVTLVLLALVMSTAVSALIYALSKSRRLFVQRTAGWTWLKALARRFAWEGGLAVVLAATMFFALGAGTRPNTWWSLAAVPLYATISIILHLTSARGVFARLLARTA